MSTPPPLPPPPYGSLGSWPPSQPDDRSVDPRPAWRQGRPGWALLHLLIGFGVWFAGLAALGVVLAMAGRQDDQLNRLDNNGGLFLLSLVGAIVGWFLFAYVDGSPARRWAIFGCVAGGTWLVALAIALNTTM